MRRWSIRWSLAGVFALLVTLVLSAPIPPLEQSFADQAAVEPVEVPPLGVTGFPRGESAKSEPVPGDVLLEPPSDAVPVKESLDERLERELAAAPKPVVVGFDDELSVENVAGRSAHGTTFDNVDGTQTLVLDDHLVHYLVEGKWELIDPRVVKTASGEWVTKANDRVATFSSAGIELASGGHSVGWTPADVSLPEPEVSLDGLTVTYREVWPGVDLRYRLGTDMVKEEIVVSDPASMPADGVFAFEFSGPGVKLDERGVLAFEGALADDLFFGGVEVTNAQGLPISTSEVVSLGVAGRRVVGDTKRDRLSVGVDPGWVSKLPADAFPLVIDPTTGWGAAIQNAEASNYAWCPTNPWCSVARVGNFYWSGVNSYWHTGVGFGYSSVLPTATVASQLTAASLHLSYAGGNTAWHPIAVRHATSYNYCGTNYNNDCGQGYTPILPLQWLSTGAVYYDVMSFVSPYWYAGAPTVGFALSSSEGPGQFSYKELNTALYLTYNRLPVPQQANMSPANPYTFHWSTSGISLSINQLSDPDGEALYYRFVLCNSGCTTIWDDSGWDSVGNPDSQPWTYVSGLYPPGPGLTAAFYNQQLYWQVMVSNSSTGAGLVVYSPWNAWKLQNLCPAIPQMSDPAGGSSGGFVWAPNNPPTLTITPYADPDGDDVRYQFVIREKGSSGLLMVTDWSPFSFGTAPISYTIPADAGLQPGVSYEWSAQAQDGPTYFHQYYYGNGPCAAASSFRTAEFEARLGAGGPSPTQSLGPVTVNLATGNVTTAISTPQIVTLGGAMGASLSYNSRANDIGLRARLYHDANSNMVPDPAEIVTTRVDREMSFSWATPSAVPGITNFVGTWTGYLTVPTSGTYHIAAAVGSDERVEVKVGTGYTMQANYVNPAAIALGLPPNLDPPTYNAYTNVTATSGGFTATAWQVYPITVTYRNPTGAGHLALFLSKNNANYGGLPTTWLSPDVRVVPRGWTFNHLEGAGASYTSARVEATEIVLTRADGSTVSYARNATGGYTTPPNEDDIVTLTNGKVSVTDVGGAVHQFNADGLLETVTAPADTKTPAAPTPVWTSVVLPGSTVATSRMTALTDPISGRQVVFKYQDIASFVCPTDGGFASVPAGMLCRIDYPDGSSTKLFYVADGQGSVQLSRVQNPGDTTLGYPTLDLGYSQVTMPAPSGGTYTVPLLSTVRDPLVNDAIAAGVITDLVEYRTVIGYDSAGRVASVTAPNPSTVSGSFRQHVDVDYQIVGGVTFNETRLHVLGLDDPGSSTDWDRKVEFDSSARTTREYQALNATSTQFVLSEYGWDGNSSSDRMLWSKSAKQLTSYVYSPEGWLTDTYGPANESCFSSTTKLPNGTCASPAVPHTSSVYDGGLTGLSLAVWPNDPVTGLPFSGRPSNMATGIAGSSSLSYNWSTSGPAEATNAAGGQLTDNFSMRLTGSVVFPQTGTYTFSSNSPDDVLNVYVDDQLVFAGVYGVNSSGVFYLAPGSSLTRRIRLDYVEFTGGAAFTLNWAGPGVTGTVPVPIAALKPRYGLVTSTTVDDSGGATPSSTTTIAYAAANLDPVYGLATSVTSGGLTTTTGYETGGYRRRISRILPAGNQTTYEYYSAAAIADNPCTVATEAIHQGGLLRYTFDPAAQTGKQIVSEQVYDVLGRPVASRRGTRTGVANPIWESTWSCVTFDARQRPTTVTIPNNAGTAIERTITTSYAVGGDPRKASVTDPVGTITAESDLLGRGVSYTDVWGTVTASTYDAVGEPGRLGQTTVTTSALVVAATHAWDYDRAGRLTRQYLDGATIAIPTYNTPGSPNEHTLASVSYPSGAGNAGNDTSLASIGRNTNGAVTSTTWNQGAVGFFTNTVTRSQTGRVVTDTINGSVSSFEYDIAGRLKTATQPGHVLEYQFGSTACGGTNPLNNAGANGNRTTLVDNAVTIATYCYDKADRLVSTTAAGYGGSIGYDDHGNTVTLAGETLAYDGADRHMSTTANGLTVTYTRDVTDRIVARMIPAPAATPMFRDAGLPGNNLLGSSSVELLRPLTAVTGDLLLATVATAGATVTAPAGWTAIATSSNTGVATTMFWRLASGGDPTSWTFGLSASRKAVGQIVAYSGVHASFPVDVTASAATASGTAHAAPQVTTTEDNRLVLTIAATATDSSWTPAVGTTERVDTAAVTGAPTVSVHVAEHEQTVQGLSTANTPTSAASAVGATMTVALRPANSTVATKTLRYSYSGGADNTALTMTSANVVLDRTITLPGGAVCSGLTAPTWAYPNIHGDVTYTINQTGVASGPYLYDPFGQPVTGEANTSPGDFDNGWLGQHQRPTEHQPELKPTIEMGARPYRADLGRFLRVDPIDGGATFSDYSYVVDPINGRDLNGQECLLCGLTKWAKSIKYCSTSKSVRCHGKLSPPKANNSLTLGIGGGYCLFLCLPEVGMSGDGPYIRLGLGFAIDSPSIVIDNENPHCGTSEVKAYASLSVGPAQLSAGYTRPGGGIDWTSYSDAGISLPDGGTTPRWRLLGAGAGVVKEWTGC